MALFSIQLARLVVTIMIAKESAAVAFNFIVGIHEMLNVIIRLIIILLITSARLGNNTYNHAGVGFNGIVFP
jgi:hypothetical protein